jgi:hypothetical protein
MKVKSQDWIEFKERLLALLVIVETDITLFDFPLEDKCDFTILVDGASIIPVFIKKDNAQLVEYDFSNCKTQVRKVVFSKLFDTYRVEISLKK